jgi:hypothetical protein
MGGVVVRPAGAKAATGRLFRTKAATGRLFRTKASRGSTGALGGPGGGGAHVLAEGCGGCGGGELRLRSSCLSASVVAAALIAARAEQGRPACISRLRGQGEEEEGTRNATRQAPLP